LPKGFGIDQNTIHIEDHGICHVPTLAYTLMKVNT
jgi:hypothetical protein